jgi:hypothetical protein
MKSIWLCIALLATSLLAACGGGGSGVQPMLTPKTTASLSFKATPINGAPSAPLQALQMTVNLPKGATITDVTKAVTGGSGQLVPDTLTYVAGDPYNTVSFNVIGEAITLGDVFANIKCNLATGSALDASSFYTANTPTFPLLIMYGLDAGGSSINLGPQITVTMTVELQ